MLDLLKECHKNETYVRLDTLINILNKKGKVMNFSTTEELSKGIYLSRMIENDYEVSLVITYVYDDNTYHIIGTCEGKQHADSICFSDEIKIRCVDLIMDIGSYYSTIERII